MDQEMKSKTNNQKNDEASKVMNMIADKVESVQSIYLEVKDKQPIDQKSGIVIKFMSNEKSIIDVNNENKMKLINVRPTIDQPSNDSSCYSAMIDGKNFPVPMQLEESESSEADLFVTRSELLAEENVPSIIGIQEKDQQIKSNIVDVIPSNQQQRQQQTSSVIIETHKQFQTKGTKLELTLNKVKKAIENLRPSTPISSMPTSASSMIIDYTSAGQDLVRFKWIPLQSVEEIRKNWLEWNQKQESACILMDENSLSVVDGDDQSAVYYDRYHKLFASKIRGTAFYLGRYRNHHPILVKRINTERKYFDLDATWIAIAKQICSPSKNDNEPFIKIYEIFHSPSASQIFMFVELLPNKSLHYHLRRRRSIHIDEITLWSSQLLNGIAFLQNRAIVNRSLRLEHLLLDERFNIKIINFRRAIPFWIPSPTIGRQQMNRISRRERKCRQNNHLPPECFHNNYDPQEIDLWSFAVVVCSLVTYRYPFKCMSRHIIRNMEQCWLDFKQRHQSLFITTNDGVRILEQIAEMLSMIFKQDPCKRANVNDIQKCSFYRKNNP
ncbi:protein kinase C iota type-like [Dermatophagoides pteronyssinus]|uniref:Cell cycle serine/threonine-protein kinase cdc5/MSD2 n=2 Tax=Dermatophagoides pteronyssinus TaxID=6956 RepID=A0ABQ8IZ76_DERPT|nr:uncharacterized protein LOC113790289 [Dermatophagoides pteronyssinus]KAH9415542.1 Cell cycle serine/threonine-protein kinase cdc5/MSD2 [Dermatophagoides pteronyssinus]